MASRCTLFLAMCSTHRFPCGHCAFVIRMERLGGDDWERRLVKRLMRVDCASGWPNRVANAQVEESLFVKVEQTVPVLTTRLVWERPVLRKSLVLEGVEGWKQRKVEGISEEAWPGGWISEEAWPGRWMAQVWSPYFCFWLLDF